MKIHPGVHYMTVKRAFLAGLFILVFMDNVVFSQYNTPTGIAECLKTKQCQVGLYTGFDDFKNNSPGIAAKEIEITYPDDPGEIAEGFSDDAFQVTDKSGNPSKLDRKAWGFNTGSKVFVRHKKKWFQLVVNSHFCYFEVPLQVSPPIQEEVPDNKPRKEPPVIETRSIFLLNTTTGEFETLTKEKVAAVISDNKALTRKFEKDDYAVLRLVRYLNDYYGK